MDWLRMGGRSGHIRTFDLRHHARLVILKTLQGGFCFAGPSQGNVLWVCVKQQTVF